MRKMHIQLRYYEGVIITLLKDSKEGKKHLVEYFVKVLWNKRPGYRYQQIDMRELMGEGSHNEKFEKC